MKTFRKPGSKWGADHMGPRAVIHFDGRASVPGDMMLFCNAAPDGSSRGGYGVIGLDLPGTPIALHTTLSVEGLRWFAQRTAQMADELEEAAACEANAALQKAAGK